MRKITITIISIIFSLSAALPVKAASLQLQPDKGALYPGQLWRVELRLNPEKDCLNLVNGLLDFPAEQLEVSSLDYSGSIVKLWVKEPSFDNVRGSVSFVAGLPRGFCQEYVAASGNRLLSVVFKVKAEAPQAGLLLSWADSTSLFVNNGYGTELKPKLLSGNYQIIASTTGQKINGIAKPLALIPVASDLIDKVAPADIKFSVYDFEGSRYAAFSATDQQSGIAAYRLKIGNGGWQAVSSPRLLARSEARQRLGLEVKDNAGNIAYAWYEPHVSLTDYFWMLLDALAAYWLIFAAIAAAIIIWLIIRPKPCR